MGKGGDSITAMAVVSRGRRHNLKLTLHDILTSSSIMHLASTVESAVVTVEEEEKVDEPFGLSPIQQVYFQAATDYHGRSRFNQSFSLRLTRYIEPETLGSAVKAVVAQHSMLRARFRRSSDGHWEQWISSVRTPHLLSLSFLTLIIISRNRGTAIKCIALKALAKYQH